MVKTQTVNPLIVWQLLRLSLREGLNGGTAITLNTSLFWLCNMKQLNFRHFNTNSKKFFETVNFFQEEDAKTAPKGPILFRLVYQQVFGHFTTNSDYFRRFPKATDDSRRLPKILEEVRPLPKMSEEPSKHLTVFPLERANIKKIGQFNSKH